MPAPLRNPPPEAVELIQAFEGIPDGDPSTVNIDAYLCPANVWTIGWGHAIVHDGQQLKGAANRALARQLYPGGITRDQAVALLKADLLAFCAGVQRLVKVAVDDAQFGALLAFGFNAGLGALAQSTLLRKLNAGDLAGAAEQFLVWDKARVNGVLQPLAGLTRRRRAERALFLGEDWRAVAAQRVTRSGGRVPPPVLPVPVPPADQGLGSVEAVEAVEMAAPIDSRPVSASPAAVRLRAAKKAVAKKAVAKKVVAKKVVAKQPVAKKAVAKKAVAKTAPAKKAPAKKVPAKKAPAKTVAVKASSAARTRGKRPSAA